MTKIPLRFHWDSKHAWLRVPRAVYETTCRRRPIESGNSKIDAMNEMLFLDAGTDGKAFVMAYAAAMGGGIAPELSSPTHRARLGITDCCDGAVSCIRTMPAILSGRAAGF